MSHSTMIKTLFGQEEPSIVSDSKAFLQECTKIGFKTTNLSEIDRLPKCSIISSFTNTAAKLTFEIAKNTQSKKSIFCAIQVFEPSSESALYSLQLLLKSDFEQALSKQRIVLNMLNSLRVILLTGNHK